MRYLNFILVLVIPLFSLVAEEFEGYNSAFFQVLDGEGNLLHTEEHSMLTADCEPGCFSNVFSFYTCQEGNIDVKGLFDEAFDQVCSFPYVSYGGHIYDVEMTNMEDYSCWAPVYSRYAAKLELIGYNNPDYEEERFFDIGDNDQLILRIIVAFHPDAEEPINLYERLIAEGRQE